MTLALRGWLGLAGLVLFAYAMAAIAAAGTVLQ